MKRSPKKSEGEDDILVTFLRRTRAGKYAPIDEDSLPYSRMQEQGEDEESYQEEYYYSIS